MTYYIGVPLLFLIALVEASVLPLFRVFGSQPNLMLIVLVAWLMVRGQNEALFLIPIGAVFLGLVDGAPMGTALLALAPIIVLYELRGMHLGEGQFALTLVFTGVATLLYHFVYLLVFTLRGEAGGWIGGMIDVVLPSAFLNLLFLVPVYALIYICSQDVRRATFA